eukprot:5099215-Prymnesium_polylepis.1
MPLGATMGAEGEEMASSAIDACDGVGCCCCCRGCCGRRCCRCCLAAAAAAAAVCAAAFCAPSP